MVDRFTRAEADRILTDPSASRRALPGAGDVLDAAARLDDASDPSPALLAAMVEAVSPVAPRPVPARDRRSVLARVAAGVTAGVVLTATGTAAATGSLPDSAQDRAREVAAHIGIDLPGSQDDEGQDGGHTHGAGVSDVASDPSTDDVGAAVSEKARDGHGTIPVGGPGSTSDGSHDPTGPSAAAQSEDVRDQGDGATTTRPPAEPAPTEPPPAPTTTPVSVPPSTTTPAPAGSEPEPPQSPSDDQSAGAEAGPDTPTPTGGPAR